MKVQLLLALAAIPASAISLPPALEHGFLPSLLPAIYHHPLVQKYACGGPNKQACKGTLECRIRPGECRADSDAPGLCLPTPPLCLFPGPRVCGCDGKEYDSACYAYMNGTNVATFSSCDGAPDEPVPYPMYLPHSNPPPQPLSPPPYYTPPCNASLACPQHQFCDYFACNDALAQGSCLNVPRECLNEPPAPVCGCDGYTYDNPCEAARASVSVYYSGVCAPMPAIYPIPYAPTAPTAELCGWIPGGDFTWCKDPRAHCVTPTDSGCDAQKICVIPEETPCPDGPVCTCLGATEVSECAAWESGIGVDYRGECYAHPQAPAAPVIPPLAPEDQTECSSNDDCFNPNSYCAKPDASCYSVGKCQIVEPCSTNTSSSELFCGCDGSTYSSRCELAYLGRTNLESYGTCLWSPPGSPPPPATEPGLEPQFVCEDDESCPGGSFCRRDFTLCGASEGYGECSEVPTSCPNDSADDWVCGCDGTMYRTPCEAAMNRVSVTTYDECSYNPVY